MGGGPASQYGASHAVQFLSFCCTCEEGEVHLFALLLLRYQNLELELLQPSCTTSGKPSRGGR